MPGLTRRGAREQIHHDRLPTIDCALKLCNDPQPPVATCALLADGWFGGGRTRKRALFSKSNANVRLRRDSLVCRRTHVRTLRRLTGD